MKDLVVVGGGPVGLATAIGAALAGLDVALVEPREGPLDKACGEGLMPSAVAALERLGVHPDGVPFRGIAYLDASAGLAPSAGLDASAGPACRRAVAPFRAGPGLGVRRTTLSAALAARADAVGVQRVPRRAGDLVRVPGGVEVAGVRGRYLVAADGLHSPIRRRLGLDAPVRGPARYGLRRHYALAPWTDLVEVHWARDAEAYVTPVAPDVVGVAVLCGGGEPYDAWLARFPALRERLTRADPASDVRGAGRLRQKAVRHVDGNVLLVGDASGYVDALTGEGISIGLACAREAVRALAAGRPQDYEAAWWRTTRRYRLLTGCLVRAAHRPVLRASIVPAAQRLPRVFTGIVNSL